MSLLNCNQSYTQDISGCADSLTFQSTSLIADKDYIVKFTYANGWVVKKEVTSSVYDATININNNGFWNVGTGVVLVEILDGCTPVVFDICGNPFSSITLNFINITTDDTDATIPCNCPE